MNSNELRKHMEKNRVCQHAYSINDGLKDDAYHLIKENGSWHVFYMERGVRSIHSEFESETQACGCFYKLTKKHLKIL